VSFSDIFKKDFLESAAGNLTAADIALTMLFSLLLGLFIFFVYRKTFQGVMYSKTFNVSLIALSMVSSTVILAVTSNVVLSLGMVGALSIVRFRTAIKDPIDIVYMFWAVGVGIIVGAGIYLLAFISSAVIGLVLYILSRASFRAEPYLLVIHYRGDETENLVFGILSEQLGLYRVKSKTKTPGCYELTVEIRAKSDKSNIVNRLDAVEGVTDVAMVSYDGEYAA
jgi:uncharacterized membrane protein YhiD involved in acid resistance